MRRTGDDDEPGGEGDSEDNPEREHESDRTCADDCEPPDDGSRSANSIRSAELFALPLTNVTLARSAKGPGCSSLPGPSLHATNPQVEGRGAAAFQNSYHTSATVDAPSIGGAPRKERGAPDCRQQRQAAGAAKAALNCGRVHGGFICTRIVRRPSMLRVPGSSGGH